MTRQRLVLISIGVVVLAAVIWVARSPSVDVAPATDETPVSVPQLGFERETINESEQQTAEVAATLSEAEAEIERLRAELAATREQEEGRDDFSEPRGYSGKARVYVSDARSAFEAELVNSSWAPDAQSELYENILNKISNDGLQVNIVDVRCKTDACRVEMSYPRQPADMSELAEITQPGVELTRQMSSETDLVFFSGLFHVRGMFPGEPTTSELYLFRTGTDGIVHTIESPRGLMILDLAGQNPSGRSGL